MTLPIQQSLLLWDCNPPSTVTINIQPSQHDIALEQQKAAEQAKAAAAAKKAQAYANLTVKTPKPGTRCEQAHLGDAYMTELGIPESDWFSVNYIICHEGHWDPCIVNGGAHDCSYSGTKAYGICQSKPGNKMAIAGADWRTNPVTQLRWCSLYAAGLGGWHSSYLVWISKGWW